MASPWPKLLSRVERHKVRIITLLNGAALFLVFGAVTGAVGASICPVYRLLGIRCLGCGMTRAFLAILRLDFRSAFRYHVLSIPLFAGIVAYVVLLLMDLAFDSRWIEAAERVLASKLMQGLCVAALVISGVLRYGVGF